MNANRILFELLICGVLFLTGYFMGKDDERTDQRARVATAMETVIAEHNQTAVVGQQVERRSVQRASATETLFNGITQGAILYAQSHPVADDCRLDADGLRLWTRANAGAEAAAAGDQPGDVSASVAAGERRADGSADQSHPDGQGVSPMPGSAPGAARLAGGY